MGNNIVVTRSQHIFCHSGQIVNRLGFSGHINFPSLILLSFTLHLKNVNATISCGQYTDRLRMGAGLRERERPIGL